MPQPKIIALELVIEKCSEFIEWLFEKKSKSESEKIIELDLILKKNLDISIFDVSESPLETLKLKLKKADIALLEDIISSLYKFSISKHKNPIFQKLRDTGKLQKRILELILYTENRYNKLSLESYNIKNSLQQMLNPHV